VLVEANAWCCAALQLPCWAAVPAEDPALKKQGQLVSLRCGVSALCPDVNARCCWFFSLQGNKSFFSEIIASISDIRFSRDGRYILSRDYMNLKLWDMAMENKPVVTLAVHEELRPRVGSNRPSSVS
jgi:hypothetical protein